MSLTGADNNPRGIRFVNWSEYLIAPNRSVYNPTSSPPNYVYYQISFDLTNDTVTVK